ncbi:MAG: hypothetical protein AAFU71_19450 [Cyanobacteria bacterium J06632_22]
MRPSASFRYKLARLQSLANPLILIPASILALMVVLMVEYGKDPSASQWQDPDDVSELTPDQQGQAAEAQFDTLRQLLNEPQPAANPNEGTAEAVEQGEADGENPFDETVSNDDAPFAEYLEQYSFGNGIRSGTTPRRNGNGGTQLASPTPSRFTTSSTEQSRLDASATAGESALSLAIGRLQGQLDSETITSESDPDTRESSTTDSSVNGFANLPLDQSDVVRGSLPGSDTTFIRTTPGMSPPPGTTGYTPPASLDLSIYNDTLNRGSASTVPGASAAPLDLQQQIPGASNNVLPTPGSVTLPGATAVPQPAPANDDVFVDQRSAYESFWD